MGEACGLDYPVRQFDEPAIREEQRVHIEGLCRELGISSVSRRMLSEMGQVQAYSLIQELREMRKGRAIDERGLIAQLSNPSGQRQSQFISIGVVMLLSPRSFNSKYPQSA